MNVIIFDVRVIEQDCIITCSDYRYGYLNRACHKSMLASAMRTISAAIAKNSMKAQFTTL